MWRQRGALRYKRLVVTWIVGVSLVGGVTIFFLEHKNPALQSSDAFGLFWDCIFVSMNGVTATGLASVDITVFKWMSQCVILLCMQLGSATMLTLCPVWIRMRSLRRALPPELVGRDLKDFHRVPQWLVEYKAMRLCMVVVLSYQAFFYGACGMLLYTMLKLDDEAASIVMSTEKGPSLEWYTIFTVVSAYCNCGFSLLDTSFVLFDEKPAVLICVEVLILAGNVLLPVLLHFALSVLVRRMSETSSSIIEARYLLLNGRNIYPNLFGMQETCVLIVVQSSLIIVQTLLTLLFASHDHTREPLGLSSAFFQSVNTRHAGMASFSMSKVDAATLLLYLLMMFLGAADDHIFHFFTSLANPSKAFNKRACWLQHHRRSSRCYNVVTGSNQQRESCGRSLRRQSSSSRSGQNSQPPTSMRMLWIRRQRLLDGC
eukprot:SAG11_NODE_100_length_16863_cov_12.374911_4_plen_430_part_00